MNSTDSSTSGYRLPCPSAGRTEWPWEERIVPPGAVPTCGSLPRISIVTPSYRQAAFIEETIRSVLLQGYPNLQYIIIDGGSTDGTVEIIKKYEKHLTSWVSERDRGQSHAINKGIARCTGDIFNWINSDDLLMPGALWAVAKAWQKKPGRIISGGAEYFNDAGVFAEGKASGQTLRNFVRFWEAEGFGWAQQSTFVPLRDVKTIGGVREDLTYCMDYHMMVRLLQGGTGVEYVDAVLARFRFHAASKTVGATEEFRLERVPMLRAMKDLSIAVERWEWNREQAKRLVDVAFHAMRRGDIASGVAFLGRALLCRPSTVTCEPLSRAICRLCGWARRL